MKQKFIIAVLLFGTCIYSQRKQPDFGKISDWENNLKIYEKDSTANAVFLYESGETRFKDSRNYILISTTHYARIKIFDREGFDEAVIEIPIFHNKEASEKVIDIKGITHNGFRQTFLNKKNIYTDKLNEHWSVVRFTLPDVHEQSIIEYQYTIETPFKFNFKGWEFQTKIPKIYSQFHALIPGNYVYNRRLSGYLKLLINDAKIKKNCFSVEGISNMADCEEVTYAMENIPAFIEEDFMTAKVNHLAAINFEPLEFSGFDGTIYKYTKSWKDVDNEFRTEKSIGVQLRKVDYLEKRLPEAILQTSDELERAKKVYSFIQNHFRWNNEIRFFNEVNVKTSFDSQIGNSAEINIALINALNAANIDVNPMLISTRDNGLPTKIHPVINDFNYIIAKVDINGKSYLLDATNRFVPFGMLPLRDLNGYGRVMDFKKGSYWFDILPPKNSLTQISLNLELDKNGDFRGTLHELNRGYPAIDKREQIVSEGVGKYQANLEDNSKFFVDSYENEDLTNIDKPLKELMDISIESQLEGEILIINPFLISKINENPFKLKERTYPVDFGYPHAFQYNLKLKIPEFYKAKSLPQNKHIKLPNNGASYIFSIENNGNYINLTSRFLLPKSIYSPEEYYYLKEFYNQIIKTQNSLITLEKI